ncbi:hypothetical protein [Methanospirillum purgamenti]|uniref:hypothetical protein n=1 Tax=Methanospirillum purgamenti TaxID=2834276 RepID=UPI002A240FC3|nr:hypothetical protein [Methanospirillum hungatei]MDX8551911.1 hypothetical protein [Methanospirillum hungatei]
MAFSWYASAHRQSKPDLIPFSPGAGRSASMPSSSPGPLVLLGNSPGIILGLRVGSPHRLHRDQYRV